jgi:hypothetical protein
MERDSATSADGGWWYRADVENGVNACRVITDLFPVDATELLGRALERAAIHRQPDRAQHLARDARERARSLAACDGRRGLRRRRAAR